MADGRPSPDQHALVDGLLAGDELALSRVISHVENREPGYREIVERLTDHTGGARTIGITGPPGAGKSTLVDSLVERYREHEETIGVVAVDPASPYTGGSILGDRIRQQALRSDDGVFFRSMSTRNRAGGLAAATYDAIRALEAFGKDVIIVETVGAGQNEVDVVKAADTVCVVLFPGAGDDIQANKAGLFEIADTFAVNKADLGGATDVVVRLQEMLELGTENGWQPPVVQTVATEGEGVEELVDAFDEHIRHLQTDDRLRRHRRKQFEHEATLHARECLHSRLDVAVAELDFDETEESPHAAARALLEKLS